MIYTAGVDRLDRSIGGHYLGEVLIATNKIALYDVRIGDKFTITSAEESASLVGQMHCSFTLQSNRDEDTTFSIGLGLLNEWFVPEAKKKPKRIKLKDLDL